MRLEIAQIKYAKAEGNYVKFVTESEQVLSRMTMQQAEDVLLPQGFLKTHRSFLVNRAFINKIEKHQLSIGKEVIPISSIYYQLLVEAIS